MATTLELKDLVNRSIPPKPWIDGEGIPWSDPEFSRRMLKEHLNPNHDGASRRPDLIDEHVSWLHEEILGGQPTRILDLGCGPGLYAVRLARLGHEVLGIDYSPASLTYARQLAIETGVECSFIEGDLRSIRPEGSFGLVMQIFSELNVFRREQAMQIVATSAEALEPGGHLVFEVDMPGTIQKIGSSSQVWRANREGLFSARPHLYLEESFWDTSERTAIKRYWIVDAETAEVTLHSSSFVAYENHEYQQMFTGAGLSDFKLIAEYPCNASGSLDDQRWMAVGTK